MRDGHSDQHTVNSIIALSNINNAVDGNIEKNRLLTLRSESELYRIGEKTPTASTPPLLHNPSKSALDLCLILYSIITYRCHINDVIIVSVLKYVGSPDRRCIVCPSPQTQSRAAQSQGRQNEQKN